MSITVGQIPIEGASRLVLPDLRDREVVDELLARAERDAGSTRNYVEFHTDGVFQYRVYLERSQTRRPITRRARLTMVAVSILLAILASSAALLLSAGHDSIAFILLAATTTFQLLVALIGALSLRK